MAAPADASTSFFKLITSSTLLSATHKVIELIYITQLATSFASTYDAEGKKVTDMTKFTAYTALFTAISNIVLSKELLEVIKSNVMYAYYVARKSVLSFTLNDETAPRVSQLVRSYNNRFRLTWENTSAEMQAYSSQIAQYLRDTFPITTQAVKEQNVIIRDDQISVVPINWAQHADDFFKVVSALAPYGVVIYISNGKINNHITLEFTNNKPILSYTSKDVLDEFNALLREKYIGYAGKQKIVCNIYELTKDLNYKLVSPMRKTNEWNLFVSRHKPTIQRLLENAKAHENDCINTKFNGYASSNVGFFLHGPPGTGKTTVIKAIALFLERDIVMVNMQEIQTVEQFKAIFAEEQKRIDTDGANARRVIYTFDEIDTTVGFLTREEKTDEDTMNKKHSEKYEKLNEELMRLLTLTSNATQGANIDEIKEKITDTKRLMNIEKNRLTISTILTELDGVVNMFGRVIIATTNYVTRIDPAILRPGRFDYIINLDKFNREEIVEILGKMYKDVLEEYPSYVDLINNAKFIVPSEETPDDGFTPATIINMAQKLGSLPELVAYLCGKTKLQ